MMSASLLERLPVELLQFIFVLADCSLALAQTSNLLGARLSNDYIYNSVCDRYLSESSDSLPDGASAQTFIFSRRWMSWFFFQSWILRAYGSSGCLCGKTAQQGCFDAQWPPDFQDATRMVFSRSHLPRIAFMRARLPLKLLHGPWTTDKIQFLRFLLWTTSMSVDWANAETRPTVLQGRRDSMRQCSLEAVELFNHNRRLGKAPTLETVRFAVADSGCDRSIVYDTILSAHNWGLRGESWNCWRLDEWCEKRIAEQDGRGLWLRTILEALRSGATLSTLKEGDIGRVHEKLIVHDLEWNKPILTRGWLLVLPSTLMHQHVTHSIRWTSVMQQPGPRMYCGPSHPIKHQCWAGTVNGGTAQAGLAWLSVPVSN